MSQTISTSPRPAATPCFKRKGLNASGCARASAADAEYTITSPNASSSVTVVKSTLSNASFFAIRPSQYFSHEVLEDLAAMAEVAELVEACAGRREHHGLACLRLP